ncbi:MAG: polyamine aminopropyltransferase [Desulfomonilia bacterium]
MDMNNWFIEEFQGQVGGLCFRINKVLFEADSPYQNIKVVRNSFFGNVMLLDDLVMLTEKDEFFYHDMLVHVPMVCADTPKDILIIGGGDGGSVREVLKHPGVKRVVLCEIDTLVIDVAKKFFPGLASCLKDKRVDVQVADGIEYVKAHTGAFDCICIDSTDPIGPAVGLFTADFYANVKQALTPTGVMSAQTDSPTWCLESVARIVTNIRKGFGNANVYLTPVPCYPSGLWSFTCATADGRNPAEQFDLKRAKAVSSRCSYYNPEIHTASFVLPNFIKEAL